MSKVTVFVGLDYHKDSIQACIMDASGKVLSNQRCPNSVAVLVARVAKFGDDIRASVEACSGSAALADELVGRHEWSVQMAHPGYVARMKRSADKTDWGDARVLADLVRVTYLPEVWLAPPEIRDLRALVRFRQQLVAARRSVKLRITALLREARVVEPRSRWSKPWLAWLRAVELAPQARWILDDHIADLAHLDARVEKAGRRLEEATADDPVVAGLLAQKGVGPITACTLRAEVGRFDRFGTGKQLARYCGLSPRNASSGKRQSDSGLIKAGNPQLRATLIEAAQRLVRYDPRWSALASKMQAGGKPKCVVVAAVANRWVRWLFHQVRGEAPASPAAA